MIEIEFEAPKIEKCDCCGQEIVRLTRLVNEDENAFAIYYLNFTRGHSPKVAYELIGMGRRCRTQRQTGLSI